MWIARLLLTMLIVIIIVGFSIYNASEKVTVRLLQHTYVDVPMIFVAYWAFVVGMLVAFVLGITYYAKMHQQLAEQRKENKKLISELAALRNVALEEAEE